MYIYIKNGRIVGCSKVGTLSLGEPIKVDVSGYYRYEGGQLFYIDTLEKLRASDFFVGERDFNSLIKARGEVINSSPVSDIDENTSLEDIEKIVEEGDTSGNILLKELNKESAESA